MDTDIYTMDDPFVFFSFILIKIVFICLSSQKKN